MASDGIWLTGARWNERFCLDPATGEIVDRREVYDHSPGDGVGRSCGGRFVAVYIDPETDELTLQVAKERVVLGDDVSATYRKRLAGLGSELTVRSGSAIVVSVRAFTPARFALRRVDPAYDELDESNDDFLMDVADIVNSQARQDAFRSARDEWAEANE
jgi:hypothetical protein